MVSRTLQCRCILLFIFSIVAGPMRVAVLLITPAEATIPPQPDLVRRGYETVFQERRRLGIDYKYTTKWISPELCRRISETKCQVWDEAFGKTIEKNRNFLTPERRNRLNRRLRRLRRRQLQTVEDYEEFQEENENVEQEPNVQQEGESEADGDGEQEGGEEENIDGIKALVMLLQWTDHDERLLIPPEHIEQLFNSDDIDQELFPTGSVKRYFNVSSYGQFTVVADIVPWIMTDNTEAFYASFGDSGRGPEIQNAFTPLLETLDASGEGTDGFDFSPYDSDGDNVIDMVVFLHSGYAAELGGEDCDSLAEADARIGSQASTSMESQMGWRSVQGFELGAYVVASAFRGTCGSNIARIGTIVHEMSHPFGLPDLYDLEGPLNPTGNVGGLGNYDIMSNPNGQMNSQARPGHYSAWSKIQMGWIEPMELTERGMYSLRPVELYPDVYRISMNFQPGEYLLLEYRRPIPGDFDERFWEPGGIVIYHVDENNLGTENNRRGGPFQEDWPLNGNHYAVAVLQDDGFYEIEQALNGGHNLDYFYQANQTLGPGNGEVIADTGTYPNTDSYAFGVVQTTGIDLRGFQSLDDGMVSFQVDTLQIIIESEVPTASPSESLQPTMSIPPTDLPSEAPSNGPTNLPTVFPTSSVRPTMPEGMTMEPTQIPSSTPSMPEGMTASPSNRPTASPTMPEGMTASPTSGPTMNPTMPEGMTRAPTQIPSAAPSMAEGMTATPTSRPTFSPTMPEGMTASPTVATSSPTKEPTTTPTSAPTMPEGMTASPTVVTPSPTRDPTKNPTAAPTMPEGMTASPTIATDSPTESPTPIPTMSPVQATPLPTLPPRTMAPAVMPVLPPALPATKQPAMSPIINIPPISRPTVSRPSPAHPVPGSGKGRRSSKSQGKGKGKGSEKSRGKGSKKDKGKGKGSSRRSKHDKSRKGGGKSTSSSRSSSRKSGGVWTNHRPPYAESGGMESQQQGSGQGSDIDHTRVKPDSDPQLGSGNPDSWYMAGASETSVAVGNTKGSSSAYQMVSNNAGSDKTTRRRRDPYLSKARRAKWRVLETGSAVIERSKKFRTLSSKRKWRGK